VPVNVTIGGGSNSAGLTASPNPVNFNIPIVVGSGASDCHVLHLTDLRRRSPAYEFSGGQSWLIVDCCGGTTINVRINGANLTAGSYSATPYGNDDIGDADLTSNLTVEAAAQRSRGYSESGHSHTAVGGSSSSQQVTITYNGSPASVTGATVSTATGQNWLQATLQVGAPCS